MLTSAFTLMDDDSSSVELFEPSPPQMYPYFAQLAGKRVILASLSPRRIEIFKNAGFFPECLGSGFAEDMNWRDFPTPLCYIKDNCLRKAEAVLEAQRNAPIPPSLIISGDTIVECEGIVYEKPVDREDAQRMLRALSGKAVNVITAVTMIYRPHFRDNDRYDQLTLVDTATIKMVNYDDAMINAYLDMGHGMDNSGALEIQGGAAILCESINGDLQTVIGFPMAKFYQELGKIVTFIR